MVSRQRKLCGSQFVARDSQLAARSSRLATGGPQINAAGLQNSYVVILSGVSRKRSVLLTESKDPLIGGNIRGVDGRFHPDRIGKSPNPGALHSGLNQEKTTAEHPNRFSAIK